MVGLGCANPTYKRWDYAHDFTKTLKHFELTDTLNSLYGSDSCHVITGGYHGENSSQNRNYPGSFVHRPS